MDNFLKLPVLLKCSERHQSGKRLYFNCLRCVMEIGMILFAGLYSIARLNGCLGDLLDNDCYASLAVFLTQVQ